MKYYLVWGWTQNLTFVQSWKDWYDRRCTVHTLSSLNHPKGCCCIFLLRCIMMESEVALLWSSSLLDCQSTWDITTCAIITISLIQTTSVLHWMFAFLSQNLAENCNKMIFVCPFRRIPYWNIGLVFIGNAEVGSDWSKRCFYGSNNTIFKLCQR